MSSVASGTSRRSHTKSRKGCKTCKKRHIRCDESYPQCRNCTKHHVRCDYMDATSMDDVPGPAASPGFIGPPEVENAIMEWQQTGIAQVDSLSINLNEQLIDFTANDLRLLYHILKAGQSSESRQYTIWTNTFAQGLAEAQRHPFLMHAGFAFTAFSLAFETGSVDAKGLAYHYGGIALRGLHQAINHFSPDNGDAVLLASRLLAWQANDWQNWASLTAGIRTIVNSLLETQERSSIPHVIQQENANIPVQFPSTQRAPITDDFYAHYVSILQQCVTACDSLIPYLAGRGSDVRFVEQLKDYVRRLLGVRPAFTPEEQFNHLYALRKWLFYVPVMCLRNPGKDLVTLIVIAYYYAVALQMDTLFPNVARAFCSGASEAPLRETLSVFERQLAAHPADESLRMQSTLLAFPRQAMESYQHRQLERRNSDMSEATQSFEGFSEQLFSLENLGLGAQRSPGFMPAGARAREVSRASSTSGSMYLEVPTLASDPPQDYGASMGMPLSLEPEEMSYGEMGMDLPGGSGYTQPQYGPYDPHQSGSSSRQ